MFTETSGDQGGTRVPEWWWSVLLSFIPINPDNRPAICGHLKTGSQYRGLLSKWRNQIFTLLYISFIKRSKLKWQLKVFFLCFCDCYVPSASQVTRMVLWSPHCARPWYWGGVVWTNSRHLPLCDSGADTGCGVSLGAASSHLAGYSPARWSAAQSTGQTHNLIMGSRHTSKDSSSVQFSFYLCEFLFQRIWFFLV